MSKCILVVSPVPTHPQTAGNRVRIGTVVSSLKKMGHDVHLLHIERESGDQDAMKKAWGDSYHSIAYRCPPKSLFYRVQRKLRSFVDKESRYRYSLDEWWDNAANSVLQRLQAQFEFDVVIVEYVFFSKALKYFKPNVLKIIDTHDVFSERHKLFLKNNMPPVWYSTSQKEEKKGLDRANLVIAIQDSECDFFSRLSHTPVITVGHAVSLVASSTQAEPGIGHKILYVASDNPNNLEAINWYIQFVFAEVRKKIPDAELLIAGKICESLPDAEAVIKLGIVDDLSKVYECAALVINPMFRGTGLKIKNVEALGYSKALVTSPVGAEGMEAGAGSAFLVAEGVDQFVTRTVEVLTDESLLLNLSEHAHAYALAWNDKIMSNLDEALNASIFP